MFGRAGSNRRPTRFGGLRTTLLAAALLALAVLAAPSQPASAHGGDHVHDLFLEALPADNGTVIELAATVVGSGSPADDFSLSYFRYRADAGVECRVEYGDLSASSWQQLGLTEAEWGLQRDIFRADSITVFKSEVADSALNLHRHTHTVTEPLLALEAGDLQPFVDGGARLQFCFLLFNADGSRSFNLDFNLWVADLGAVADQPATAAEPAAAVEADGSQAPETRPAEPETIAQTDREEGEAATEQGSSAAIWAAVIGGSLFLIIIVATVIATVAGAKNPGSGPTA
ncbi:hypothetical protein F4X86_00635 [Candidatus Saccharibacteria bacterium]|nr:hypothetical protein [Candidatus Saccharibacteria bacterium]